MRHCILIVVLPTVVAAQVASLPPRELPATAATHLVQSLDAARAHTSHVWRDTKPINDDGTVNAYVEIPRGEVRKFEFDMRANARAIDRVMPPEIGGYPVNYGFVPQTVSYDGDPFDALVLGPPLEGGALVRGRIVGVMFMEDEKGLDSKVVLSRIDATGRYLDELTANARQEIGDYFARYKEHQPGAFSKVSGWGSVAEGRAFITMTHAFFRECRHDAGPCVVTTKVQDGGSGRRFR